MEIFPFSNYSRNYYSEQPFKEQKRTQFENGIVQSRPVHTKGRMKYTFGWKYLRNDLYEAFKNFFFRNVGDSFIWKDRKGIDRIVMFSEGSLPAAKLVRQGGGGFWDTGAIKIEEK